MEETKWHLHSVEEALSKLRVSRHGLSLQETREREKQFGLNRLEIGKGPSLFILLIRQFLNPLIFILVAAALFKVFVSDFLNGTVLFVTVFLMVFVGFFQEMKAEKAIEALRRLTAQKSKVMRDGKLAVIPSEQIVPGDVLLLEMGDKVPADARLMEGMNLKVNESMLNGESMPSEKHSEPLTGDQILADRKNMIYSGTVVASGRGIGVVIATGMSTELGKIAKSIKEISPEPTPLQKSVRSIGNWMLGIILCVILLFVVISLYKGLSLSDVFFLSIAAAISAIPEGLPVAFTATLAAGMRLMAKRNAFIRKLIAVETLGSTTTICSDKTGTLTQNQMTVTTVFSLDKCIEFQGGALGPVFKKAFEIGVLCNDALVSKGSEVIGDPTEGAILLAAMRLGMNRKRLEEGFPRISEIPFLSENLYMATLHSAESSRFIYVKGAPEKILSMCASILTEKGEILLNEAILEKIHHSIGDLTEKSLRMIAVAYSEISTAFGSLTEEMFEGKLVFVGMFGMMDPPRKEVVQAIQHCKEAGIRVVMITGDNPLTAKAIAKELGIVFPKVMTGDELRNLDEGAFEKQVKDISVFARVEPLQKLQIVTALKSQGEIVAMTGDGVNDAPALEAANIGIAMGITGTDVAKEAADMILADDRFDSIVAAVEEGRAIFNRLRNVCTFLITACFGELFGLILSVSFLGVAPLTPLQILWINLISGSIIAIPLGFEPKIGNEMKSPPRNVKSRLLYRGMIYRVGFLAICLGLGSFFVFDHTMKIASLEKARTMVLCSVIAFEWLIALKMRSQEFSLRKIGFFANPLLLYAIGSALVLHLIIIYTPFLGRLFALEPLTFNEWLLAIAPGGIIFFLETLRKELFPKLFNER